MNIYEAAKLTKMLMKAHRLIGWSFKFDTASVRFGRCNHRSKLITMSRKLVEANGEREVRDTILHEIAHALVGPGHGHGPVWMRKAAEIGARPEAYYDSDAVEAVPPKYIGKCSPGCVAKHRRHKMTPIIRRGTARCARCRLVIKWSMAAEV